MRPRFCERSAPARGFSRPWWRSRYSALGLLAGLIGAFGALALSWAVTRYLFRIAWSPEPLLLVAGAALTTALVAVVGVLASAEVLRQKPLGALRAE